MKKIGILGLICLSLLVASCNKNAKTETPETPVTPSETPTIETPVGVADPNAQPQEMIPVAERIESTGATVAPVLDPVAPVVSTNTDTAVAAPTAVTPTTTVKPPVAPPNFDTPPPPPAALITTPVPAAPPGGFVKPADATIPPPPTLDIAPVTIKK